MDYFTHVSRRIQMINQVIEKLNNGSLNGTLAEIYGPDAVETQRDRYIRAVERFEELFGEGPDVHIFRAPGRTEIGGNHTDHQHGQVLAAAIDRDIIAVVAAPAVVAACGADECADGNGLIRIYSEGFGWTEADLAEWTDLQPDPAEKGSVKALIHGVADGMRQIGCSTGGFCAYVTSDVPGGTGLSSSAAFEVRIGTIFNEFFNEGSVAVDEIARIAQAAENNYYGKPCGLMDQTAIASGGLCRIDFSDPASPAVEKMDADLASAGYCVCITDTHGSHAEHTDDYVAVQTDLAAAAGVFGKSVLENVGPGEVIAHSKEIREAGGDRAFLRAMHVAAENERVAGEALALEQKNMPEFLNLVRQSGNSSYKYLQNVHTDRNPARQELAVALAISEAVLGERGACRVHGGGFAGTIQAFVPEDMASAYCRAMDEAFGEGSCFVIRVCPEGGVRII